jgi:hypothetical protein
MPSIFDHSIALVSGTERDTSPQKLVPLKLDALRNESNTARGLSQDPPRLIQ